MDYKQMIIEMVERINNEEALKIIHDFIMVPYKREISKKNKCEERES